MKEIRAVIFDLYGTLIHIHTDEWDLERLWKPLSLFYRYQGAQFTPEGLKQRYQALVQQEEQAARQRSGNTDVEINVERVFAAIYAEGGVLAPSQLISATGQMFRACSTRVAELYPGALELLATLRRQGKKVYLLSNAQRVFTEYEMKMLGLYDAFDAIRISSDWDIKKPAHAYFRCLLDELPFTPQQILMVGNSPQDDIVPAAELGLHTCFLNTDHISPPRCDLVCDGADYNTLLHFINA